MNLSSIKNNKFYIYLNNLESENIGLLSSILIHFLILFLAIGLPDFFGKKSINLPSIIPIEIVNISDVTSLERKDSEKNEKKPPSSSLNKNKFNNSERIEITKKEIKLKPEITKKEIKLKPDIPEEKKIFTPEKKKKKIIEEKMEIIPIKKIKVKLKPKIEKSTPVNEKKTDIIQKTQPKLKPKPKEQLNMASLLKDLRKKKQSIINEEQEVEKKDEDIAETKDELSDENSELSISEIDLLLQQLSGCWVATAGAKIEKGMIVTISVKLKQNGRVYDNSIRIIDTNIAKSSPVYGPITESAIRTLLNPDCVPLKLPEDKYDTWKKLTITFDHKMMRG